MTRDEKIQKIIEIMKEYLLPKKEFDHIAPSEVAGKILDAVEPAN